MRSWDYRCFRLVAKDPEMILKVGFRPEYQSIGFWDQYQQRQSAEVMAVNLCRQWPFRINETLILKVMVSKRRP